MNEQDLKDIGYNPQNVAPLDHQQCQRLVDDVGDFGKSVIVTKLTGTNQIENMGAWLYFLADIPREQSNHLADQVGKMTPKQRSLDATIAIKKALEQKPLTPLEKTLLLLTLTTAPDKLAAVLLPRVPEFVGALAGWSSERIEEFLDQAMNMVNDNPDLTNAMEKDIEQRRKEHKASLN